MNEFTRKSVSLLLSGTFLLGVAPHHLTGHIAKASEMIATEVLSSNSGSCGENLTWFYEEGSLTIRGTGDMYDFRYNASPWIDYKEQIKTIDISDGVTSIGTYAFSECRSMISVNIPQTVHSIGQKGFYYCENLISCSLPQGITRINEGTFSFCKKLESITLPDSLTYIGEAAFLFCYALKNINIPSQLTNLEKSAFYGCNSLTAMNIPSNMTEVPINLFRECYNLEAITIPSEVTIIQSGAFFQCKTLKTVAVPDKVEVIVSVAFSNCTALHSIYLPKSLTTVGGQAFGSAVELKDVYYAGTEEEWNLIDFTNGNEYLLRANIHYNSTIEDLYPQESNSVALPISTLHTSYLTQIPNITTSSTLLSGSLPKGLGIYPDGTIGGIPTQTGTFQFVISTSEGEVGYSITVQESTMENVEVNNDFDIIERIPTVDSNDNSYVFEVSGEYGDFLHVYLNGELLIGEVDYTAEEGSTKITIAAQTFAQLDQGSHTINATFTPTSVTVSPSTSTTTPSTSTTTPSTNTTTTSSGSTNVTVQKVAQTFEKTVSASSTVVVMPFTDVTQQDWFYTQILFCYKNGTFSGVTETTYEPNTGMTRGMMAVVLYALANKPSSDTVGFSDVVEGQWYYDAVNWLSQKGIDDSTDAFRPTELITREETAKMLYNFCTDQGIFLPLVTSGSVHDIDSVSEYAQLAVTALFQRNIFAGDESGNFNPEKSSTRAEISTIMKNFISTVM